jgi:predicted GNAT family N-acyltransferase
MSNPFTVSLVTWHDAEPLLRSIRESVFIIEQGVPAALEWDGLDENARHALAISLQGDAVGCGRMLSNGHIGRISVLPQWRKQKVGTAIMEALLAYARNHEYNSVDVDAQTYAMPFYHKFEFVEQGNVFMDAGLPHIKMRLKLSPV